MTEPHEKRESKRLGKSRGKNNKAMLQQKKLEFNKIQAFLR